VTRSLAAKSVSSSSKNTHAPTEELRYSTWFFTRGICKFWAKLLDWLTISRAMSPVMLEPTAGAAKSVAAVKLGSLVRTQPWEPETVEYAEMRRQSRSMMNERVTPAVGTGIVRVRPISVEDASP
jgi:hypothetical protein